MWCVCTTFPTPFPIFVFVFETEVVGQRIYTTHNHELRHTHVHTHPPMPLLTSGRGAWCDGKGLWRKTMLWTCMHCDRGLLLVLPLMLVLALLSARPGGRRKLTSEMLPAAALKVL